MSSTPYFPVDRRTASRGPSTDSSGARPPSYNFTDELVTPAPLLVQDYTESILLERHAYARRFLQLPKLTPNAKRLRVYYEKALEVAIKNTNPLLREVSIKRAKAAELMMANHDSVAATCITSWDCMACFARLILRWRQREYLCRYGGYLLKGICTTMRPEQIKSHLDKWARIRNLLNGEDRARAHCSAYLTLMPIHAFVRRACAIIGLDSSVVIKSVKEYTEEDVCVYLFENEFNFDIIDFTAPLPLAHLLYRDLNGIDAAFFDDTELVDKKDLRYLIAGLIKRYFTFPDSYKLVPSQWEPTEAYKERIRENWQHRADTRRANATSIARTKRRHQEKMEQVALLTEDRVGTCSIDPLFLVAEKNQQVDRLRVIDRFLELFTEQDWKHFWVDQLSRENERDVSLCRADMQALLTEHEMRRL
jgi:hypothetical protein